MIREGVQVMSPIHFSQLFQMRDRIGHTQNLILKMISRQSLIFLTRSRQKPF